MKPLLPMTLCSILTLTGCSLFGYRIYKEAERPLLEQAGKVEFPNSFEGSARLSGSMMKALSVAMNDFLPPGTKPESEKDIVARCLSRWETFSISVLRAHDNLFFIRFSPDKLPECAPGRIVLDAGATYAVDGDGRILAVND